MRLVVAPIWGPSLPVFPYQVSQTRRLAKQARRFPAMMQTIRAMRELSANIAEAELSEAQFRATVIALLMIGVLLVGIIALAVVPAMAVIGKGGKQ